MVETIGVVPFSTPAGYEIVYCSLETSRLIFLDRIPRPDKGCLPGIGSLKLSRECSSEQGIRDGGCAHFCDLTLPFIFLLQSLAFAFPSWLIVVQRCIRLIGVDVHGPRGNRDLVVCRRSTVDRTMRMRFLNCFYPRSHSHQSYFTGQRSERLSLLHQLRYASASGTVGGGGAEGNRSPIRQRFDHRQRRPLMAPATTLQATSQGPVPES